MIVARSSGSAAFRLKSAFIGVHRRLIFLRDVRWESTIYQPPVNADFRIGGGSSMVFLESHETWIENATWL